MVWTSEQPISMRACVVSGGSGRDPSLVSSATCTLAMSAEGSAGDGASSDRNREDIVT